MFMRGGRLGWGFRLGDARAPMRGVMLRFTGTVVPQTCALGRRSRGKE
jgi:hypothetical protein